MATAAVMMNAANLAYHKAMAKTRNKDHLLKTHPFWMSEFAAGLSQSHNLNFSTPKKLKQTAYERKEHLEHSDDAYER
jgi:hypothetical protein